MSRMDKLKLLKNISFGERVAEDEITELAKYFVETDQWSRMLKGEIDVVRGDKGAGKSAIYSLLITRENDLFDRDTLIVPGEKPRGTPVFKDIIANPPTEEVEFVGLWKLYILALVGRKMREYDIQSTDAKKVYSTLESVHLLDREYDLTDFNAQRELFYRLFPSQVEQGTRKPSTLDWMISRCADGTRKTAPRELIHLLTSLRDKEISRIERGELPAPGEQLFDRSVFKEALPIVSETRYHQSLIAEYPDLKNLLGKLNGQKTEQTVDNLAELWEMNRDQALAQAHRLVEIGFFELRGSKDAETFWVPFLFRDALSMSQGLAD